MYICINGQLVKKEEAVISPFDHGFLYGIGLFETFRIYEGHPFLLDDHIRRLNESLQTLGIAKTFIRDEVNEWIQRLLSKNNISNANVRLNVSAGIGEVGDLTSPYPEPNVIMFMKPLPEAGVMVEKKAVLLGLNRNTPEGEWRLKSHHYMNNILAKKEIGNDPNMEGIFLTKDGFLAEGVVSNLFWIKENTLYTPSLQTGILNGITRQFIFKLAERNSITVEEGFFKPNVLEKAEEVFVTNSIQEIVPISTFEDVDFPGNKGKWVQEFHKQYRYYTQQIWTRTEV